MSLNLKLSTNLSPYHYVKIDSEGAFKGVSAQTPHIVLIAPGADDDGFGPPGPDDPEQIKSAVRQIERSGSGADISVLRVARAAAGPAQKGEKPESLSNRVSRHLPERRFTHFVMLSYDEPIIRAFKTILERRWGHAEQLDGVLFAAALKDKAKKDLNSPYICLIPLKSEYDNEGTWATGFCASNAAHFAEPARPYQNIVVSGIETKEGEGYTHAQRGKLLADGLCSWRKEGDDIVMDRLVTTYLKAQSGADDPSMKDLNTIQTLSLIRHDFKTSAALRYPRHMLAKDDHPYSGPVVTPKALKTFVITKYRQWQENNLVQDEGGQFAKNVKVEVNANSPGTVDIHLPIQVMGQWRITQTIIQFSL